MTPREILKAVEKCYPIAADAAIGAVIKDEMGIADVLMAKARGCLKPGARERGDAP